MKSIEILGPWLKNKGDELMFRSILERLQPQYEFGVSTDLNIDGQEDLPKLLRFTFQPTYNEMQEAFRKRSFTRLISVTKRGIILPLLPQTVLQSMGLLNARNLVALFDCSGFAYGDQWSPNRMIKRIKYYEWLQQRGIKLIMLPQALGPFDDPDIRSHARRLLNQFDLIFPREEASKEHVLDLGIDATTVEACPDISHLLQSNPPPQREKWSERVTIVPNARMLDKTSSDIAENYLDFLVICVNRIRANNLEPVILLHETNDDIIINQLLDRLNTHPEVVDENGLISKGYLSTCYANIGSRYHSLVSSLSQSTPSLGTSWAHKYELLFKEYDCEDCLISPAENKNIISLKIDEFLTAEHNNQLQEKLQVYADKQKSKVEKMWQQVEALISNPD